MPKPSGFTLIENLIAIVLMATLFTGAASAYGSLVLSKTRARHFWTATQYAKSSMETITNAFQQAKGWKFFQPHLKTKKGACNRITILYPASGYNFSEGKDKEELASLYEREIQFCSVARDKDGNITQDGTGTFDPNTAKIVVTITPIHPGLFNPIIFSSYVSNVYQVLK